MLIKLILDRNENNSSKRKLNEVSNEINLATFSNLKLVAGNFGANFTYCDRDDTFQSITDIFQTCYTSFKNKFYTKETHPFVCIADGPGSGKSRFLQELASETYKSFIERTIKSDDAEPNKVDFKKALSQALFVNITFNSSTSLNDIDKKGSVDQWIVSRISYSLEGDLNLSYYSFLKSNHPDPDMSFLNFLSKLAKLNTFVILGIDEINQLDNEQISSLIRCVTSASYQTECCFVPILVGTVVKSIKELIRKSMATCIQLNLSNLSIDSCLTIAFKKIPSLTMQQLSDDILNKLKLLISYSGGHCRAFEFICEAIYKLPVINSDSLNQAFKIATYNLEEKYSASTFTNFGYLIAYYYLGYNGISYDAASFKEVGLIKIVNNCLSIPYIFVCCYLRYSESPLSKNWTNLLAIDTIYWQNWEDFNWRYMAFRLSLYSFLGKTEIKLAELFGGSIHEFSNLITIKVPCLDKIDAIKLTHIYPNSDFKQVPGVCYKNADHGSFDSFMLLNTTSNENLYLIIQSMHANSDSASPQVIKQQTINAEFGKINETMNTKDIKRDFVCIYLCNCDQVEGDLIFASKSVLVTKAQHRAFFGPAYLQLNID